MPTDHRAKLATIKRFDQLIAYLRDEMAWPIENGSSFEDLTFEYLPDELGIDAKTAAKIQEIKRLRPLSPKQPWGIFFVKFEPKRLPVVALRRILGQVALKKRASANSAERAAWAADDLLFVSNYGEGDERQISFAHFARAQDDRDLPTLKVLGWNNNDTALHLDAVARELTEQLSWPEDDANADAWRKQWRAAFTLGHREVVTTSKGLSIRLAQLARAIRDRIKTALSIETDKGPLTRLMKAFETALVHDLDADGFADMYAQTIAYGLLSARIADPTKKTADDFAAHMRTNPFLRELMETFLRVGGRKGKADGRGNSDGIDFDELGVCEVIELLDTANVEAVVRDFGDRNPREDPVIHFYELFLKEYDAKKRMQRGVFYTPRPVVSYIVRTVDSLLRNEFGLVDGLADTSTWGEMARRDKRLSIPEGVAPEQDFVQILDPATGTGTFLVEVIELIHKTLVAKWRAQGHGETKIDVLWNEYVPKHLLRRLHGYELLMAPYAIAHLKVGLKLYETGYRFGSEERARIYLTNALEPAQDFSESLEFAIPALAHEARAVNTIKRQPRFTVVLGNPPYSSVSQNMSTYLAALVNQYLLLPDGPMQEKSNRNHLQDDYVKFIRASQAVIQGAGLGLIAMITNNSYLTGSWYRGMRYQLTKCFPTIKILNLHGGKGFVRSSAQDDENVFEIMQSVSVGFFVKPTATKCGIKYDECIGSRSYKYDRLLADDIAFDVKLEPDASNQWLFAPLSTDLQPEWNEGISVENVFIDWGAGVKTNRNGLAVGFTRQDLESQIRDFADPSQADSAIESRYSFASNYQWDTGKVRKKFAREGYDPRLVSPYLFRPFDKREIYWHPSIVFNMRGDKMEVFRTNPAPIALLFSRTTIKDSYTNFFVARLIADHDCLEKTKVAALTTGPVVPGTGFAFEAPPRLNLSRGFLERLGSKLRLGFGQGGLPEKVTEHEIFYYIYAIFYSPRYRARFAEFLKIDFPRLPLTGNLELFRDLARHGGELSALHLLESAKLSRTIAEYVGSRGCEVEKVSWSKDTVWIDKARTTGFKGVSENVWNFQIGGYQVCEKWLKDRKGRALSKDDIAHYQKIVVALSETIRLMKEIDEVIEQHGGWPGAFQGGEAKAEPATVLPFRPRTAEPKPGDRYTTCLPLIPLQAAAGAFSDPQRIQQKGWDDDFEWVAVESRHRLRKGMFVAQVVGKSMEPAIPNGAWCLFRAPVEGTRQGKTALVQLRDATDPETGQRYTVKRYESEKAAKGDSWRHERITLKPVNPEFEPIVLTGKDEDELEVIAEFLEVLGSES